MFFAVIIGSFSLGNSLPELETFATALGSASAVYDIIDKVGVACAVCGCGLCWCVVWLVWCVGVACVMWCVGGACVVCGYDLCGVCVCGVNGDWC